MRLKPFIGDEDYSKEYGLIDYAGKKVLDLGADYGSSAEFFLEKGAIQVIAVEGNKERYEKLLENSAWLKNMKPIFLFIKTPNEISKIILEDKPDVIKCDLDGGERHLFTVPDKIFSMVNEYVLEVHSLALFKACIEKFFRNGYHIVELKKLVTEKVANYAFWGDGVLITAIKPSASNRYFSAMATFFKYWEFSLKEENKDVH
jgi:predicted rRNA methylase YqxC with S4 and FtsJ domains